MKNLKKLIPVIVAIFFLSSCSNRLVDFTVISSKNVSLKFEKSQGKEVTGESIKYFGMGANIKEAMDRALTNAGPDFDLLVDGRVDQWSGLFRAGYVVHGIAISSSKIKASLGVEGWKNWCKTHNIFDPNLEESKN
ncbi:MAG: hypothetical protein WCL14_04155 [Bacteroidota bacterium]